MSTVAHQPEIWHLEDLIRHKFVVDANGQFMWKEKAVQVKPLNKHKDPARVVYTVRCVATGKLLFR
jgi:hypothetical protein